MSEPETEGTALPLVRFTMKQTPEDMARAEQWIQQWFGYLHELANVRKHIIEVYAGAAGAVKSVRDGNGGYEKVPDWAVRLESAKKMDEWYEKTINRLYQAAKDKESPIEKKEFGELGPGGMVAATYARIRENSSGGTEPDEGADARRDA